MNTITKLNDRQSKLQLRYKELMEQAYNFRQTDSAFSDISEYNAIKLLNKMNNSIFCLAIKRSSLITLNVHNNLT